MFAKDRKGLLFMAHLLCSRTFCGTQSVERYIEYWSDCRPTVFMMSVKETSGTNIIHQIVTVSSQAHSGWKWLAADDTVGSVFTLCSRWRVPMWSRTRYRRLAVAEQRSDSSRHNQLGGVESVALCQPSRHDTINYTARHIVAWNNNMSVCIHIR